MYLVSFFYPCFKINNFLSDVLLAKFPDFKSIYQTNRILATMIEFLNYVFISSFVFFLYRFENINSKDNISILRWARIVTFYFVQDGKWL